MQREARQWVADIASAGREAIEYVAGMTRAEFEADRKTVHAVSYLVLSMGEAAKNLPESFTSLHAGIDWKGLAGMRDVLAHQYFGIDLDVLWEATTSEIPAVVARLEAILGSSSPTQTS